MFAKQNKGHINTDSLSSDDLVMDERSTMSKKEHDKKQIDEFNKQVKEIEYKKRMKESNDYQTEFNKISDELASLSSSYGTDMLKSANISNQGLSYTLPIIHDIPEQISLMLDSEDWEYIFEKQGLKGFKKTLDKIAIDLIDWELHYLDKEYGYDMPDKRPTNDAEKMVAKFNGLFDSWKDEELKNYKTRESDYVKSKQIIQYIIFKTMNDAYFKLPKRHN